MSTSGRSGEKKPITVNAIIKDADLRTPLHDTLLLWLDKNLGLILGDAEHWMWAEDEVTKKLEAAKATVASQITRLESAIRACDERLAKTGSRALSEPEAERARKKYITENGSRYRDEESLSQKAELYLRDTFLTEDEIYNAAAKHLKNLRALKWTAPPDFPGCLIESKKLQHPVFQHKVDRRGREQQGPLVGYIDVAVRFRRPILQLVKTHIEFNAQAESQKPTVRWKIQHTYKLKHYYDVRASITSVGALLREIDFIRQEIDQDVDYIVVSPDERYRQVLLDQNVGFLLYEPDFEDQLAKDERYCAPLEPGEEDWQYNFDPNKIDDDDVV